MDETEVHFALRERCKEALDERGWRQIAVTVENTGDIGIAFQRSPSVTGLNPEILMVLLASRVSESLLRARMEIQSDLQLVGVITILEEPLPDLLTHAVRAEELMTEQGRFRLLEFADELETWARARNTQH